MRATGGLVVSVVSGVAIVGAGVLAACTYTSAGQGGAAGALQLADASLQASFDGGGGIVSSSGGGGDNGGSSGGNNGGSSGGGTSSGGTSSGGTGSGGGSSSSSGGVVPPRDAGPTEPCSPPAVPCDTGCCVIAPTEAGSPCPVPPNFLNDCRTYIADQDAGAKCSSCVSSQSCAGPTCVPPGCTQACSGSLTPDQLCTCIATCIQQQADTCCLQQVDQYFTCVDSPCKPACGN